MSIPVTSGAAATAAALLDAAALIEQAGIGGLFVTCYEDRVSICAGARVGDTRSRAAVVAALAGLAGAASGRRCDATSGSPAAWLQATGRVSSAGSKPGSVFLRPRPVGGISERLPEQRFLEPFGCPVRPGGPGPSRPNPQHDPTHRVPRADLLHRLARSVKRELCRDGHAQLAVRSELRDRLQPGGVDRDPERLELDSVTGRGAPAMKIPRPPSRTSPATRSAISFPVPSKSTSNPFGPALSSCWTKPGS